MRELRLGIIGLSEGNGHPFSFSAILNGYSDTGFAKANWPVIHNYLRLRKPQEFGIPGAKVTHVWTQDPALSQTICEASLVGHVVQKPGDFIGEVDGVIVARDDYETHMQFARPFLEAGLPVFMDKPLALSVEEMRFYKPFLESGQLTTCAGARYASELDSVREGIRGYGRLGLIRGTTARSWEKYGIHLIDAILNVTPARPISARALPAAHMSVEVEMNDHSKVQLDAMGDAFKAIRLEFVGSEKTTSHDLTDNFSMFKRCLDKFVTSAREKRPEIPPADVYAGMKLLMAGRLSKAEGRKVMLDEIQF